VNLLPYHRIAEGKYQRFGKENKLAGIAPPSEERMQCLNARFEAQKFKLQEER
jgi:pyruvate formate lyase activating enzyme